MFPTQGAFYRYPGEKNELNLPKTYYRDNVQHSPESAAAYGHKHALGVVFDRAEGAADEGKYSLTFR